MGNPIYSEIALIIFEFIWFGFCYKTIEDLCLEEIGHLLQYLKRVARTELPGIERIK